MPRFRQYEKTLPIDEEFESALVDVYTEVICFYARAIRFYRSNPNGLLRRNGWPAFHGDFNKTVQRIKRLSSVVEIEAETTRMKLEQKNYEEVVQLMKDMKTEKPQRHDQSCYHLPQTVNPRFWGRSEVICKIKEALDPDDQAQDQRSFAIWGMGGVGKTQIALKYVASNRQQFNTIIWISAGSSIQVSQSFRDVAGRLGFSGNDQETEDTMAAVMKVKDWLEQTSKRLHGMS